MNDNIKTAFGTVVYKGAEVYLGDFIGSLCSQKNHDFTLLMVNEDIARDDLSHLLVGYPGEVEILDCPVGEGIIEHRIRLLLEAKRRGYKLLVIGDCDDTFSSSRIDSAIKAFCRTPDAWFYYNDITDSSGNRLMPELPAETNSIDDIAEYNYLGMSNSAVNLLCISEEFINSLAEFKGSIFDWYLFSRLLLAGGKGEFYVDGETNYRLHEGNTAGIRGKTVENIKYELAVKKYHYGLLTKYDAKYERLAKKYDNIGIEVISTTERDGRLHYWWDLIRLGEENEAF